MKKIKKRKLKKEVKLFLFLFGFFIMSSCFSINVKATNLDVAETKQAKTLIPVSVEKTGIDVSKWNGMIDWQSVKDSGIDYAIIRIGYGNDDPSQDDEWATYNINECIRLDIPFGVYIYSYATNQAMALSEASHVLRMIDGQQLIYPVYLDMEDNSTKGIGSEMLGNIASTFCAAIKDAGYDVGIYSNTAWFNNVLIDPRFDSLSKWVAQYNDTCEYQGSYTMWQYTDSGRVPGISSSVDMNISYETEYVSE